MADLSTTWFCFFFMKDADLGKAADEVGGAEAETFQPMNVNFGLFPPLENAKGGRRAKADRKRLYTERAKAAFDQWLGARLAA